MSHAVESEALSLDAETPDKIWLPGWKGYIPENTVRKELPQLNEKGFILIEVDSQ